ncbi:hypothetical protein AB0M47_35010, partial [Hamadaea sp. NPDC051192]|uniref:hypothetical protein n=1 Tax=Hamadaea sp. NPDC051192 TaxID=3154940 RepID=UPI003440B1A0
DPGHGSADDPGVTVPDGPLRWSEADLAYDLATRLAYWPELVLSVAAIAVLAGAVVLRRRSRG